jgi:hypothetical protein
MYNIKEDELTLTLIKIITPNGFIIFLPFLNDTKFKVLETKNYLIVKLLLQ